VRVEALLFDLDGTLIDSRRDLAFSVQRIQRELGERVSSDDEIATYIGDGVVKLVQRALPRRRGAELRDAVRRFKRFYAQHALDTTRPYPGVRETIERLRRKKLAVVTNKPGRISRSILERLGLLEHFRLVVGGDSLAEKKPDPAPLRYAMDVMRVHPRRTVMVGDSAGDILAGRAAGTWTCGMPSNIGDRRKLISSRPDFVARGSFELLSLFR